jgi:hypothetical protein
MKKMLMKIGLKHDGIHYCLEGHILCEEDNENLDACPTCNKARYIEGSNDVLVSVLRHFSVVKRLQRMFKCPKVEAKMTWYDERRSERGIMCSIVDSEQWTSIDQMFEEFARVKTNLRLGLVVDGIISFKNAAMKHSTWVILMAICNLPLWLLTKKFFLSLVLLILGPKVPTSETIDVFLAPVVRDLLKLWKGLPCINMSKSIRQQNFILRGMLIWTVNDLLEYGLLSGQHVHGYKVVLFVVLRHVLNIPLFCTR